jgi:KaiC/GvpD/RAD55 family RecA-like ATPase|tara:strand:+ start:6132 stop:7805 length:1674 start_codon:yes stop_codon:yes gene_type:complete
MYSDDVLKYVRRNGSIGGYKGPRAIDWVILDMDIGDKEPEWFMEQVSRLDRYLQTNLGNIGYVCTFSGGGFHFMIPAATWSFESGEKLPLIVRNTVKEQFDGYGVDISPLSSSGLYRCLNSWNNKRKLYKVLTEISSIAEYQDYQDAAEEPISQKIVCKAKQGFWHDKIVITKTKFQSQISFTDTGNPRTIATCIHNMLDYGPIEGSRHQVVLRIAGHLHRRGVPLSVARSGVLDWIQDNSPEWLTAVEQAYRVPYHFSCDDYLMRKHCKSTCMFHRSKNYGSDLMTVTDLKGSLRSRLEVMKGIKLNLHGILGIDQDTDCYAGELVTLIGPTGSGKTALAQNLCMGWSMLEGRFVEEYRLAPVLFISLELSGWLIYRRFFQIATGLNKSAVMALHDKEDESSEALRMLEHLHVRTTTLEPNAIEQLIDECKPKMVVIDHVGFLDTKKRDEREQVSEAYRTFVEMKKRLGLIFLVISHVGRAEAIRIERGEGRLSLYSGKYSGDIENGSDKFIALENIPDAEGNTRGLLSMLKNRDGDSWKDLPVKMDTETFRFERR